MRHLFSLLLIISTLTISCHFGGEKIKGNGVVKTESRTVSSFKNVEVSGNINVYIKQDSVTAVRVEADEDLMKHIIIKVDDNTLIIEPKDGANLSSSQGIKVYVSSPAYKNFEASGASDIYSENKITGKEDIDIDLSGASNADIELHAPAVEADLAGASGITLRGETKTFNAEGSGASSIKCFELLSEETNVKVSGASHAKVFASVKLSSIASGASNIEYRGDPSDKGESVSGASSVKKSE